VWKLMKNKEQKLTFEERMTGIIRTIFTSRRDYAYIMKGMKLEQLIIEPTTKLKKMVYVDRLAAKLHCPATGDATPSSDAARVDGDPFDCGPADDEPVYHCNTANYDAAGNCDALFDIGVFFDDPTSFGNDPLDGSSSFGYDQLYNNGPPQLTDDMQLDLGVVEEFLRND
jgi:hypothetical protein